MLKPVILTMCASLFLFFGCKKNDSRDAAGTEAQDTLSGKIEVPSWAKNATIYELNVRQFSPEGTFKAVKPHLERLKKMGVDIIWFMPIQTISETKRKGTLGSYYAVSGYRDVNPEFGTLHDFQSLVAAIHNQGMHVLIDWVPHHTGWDHPWITGHPEYYSKDSLGNIVDPINEDTGEPWGWTDVAELDLDNQDMRKAVIADMEYWVETADIDGFRVDHAHGLPGDYWDQVSAALADNGPLFMLAEGEEPYLRNTDNFEMTYAWRFHHAMNSIAKGEEDVNILDTILAEDRAKYTSGYHMYFTSNHDENSWAGTVMERMGDGHKAFAVLASTIDGMPLLYSGQEEPITKRLEFFEKDPIEWRDYAYADFYQKLFYLKKRNKALWNGDDGGFSQRINTSEKAYAFKREKDGDKVIVVLNLSPEQHSTALFEATGEMRELFSGKPVSYRAREEISLGPWEYLVLTSR